MGSMPAENKPRGAWTAQEMAREERVSRQRVLRDRKRGATANLEEAAAFARAANSFAKAFSRDRGA